MLQLYRLSWLSGFAVNSFLRYGHHSPRARDIHLAPRGSLFKLAVRVIIETELSSKRQDAIHPNKFLSVKYFGEVSCWQGRQDINSVNLGA